MTPQTYKEQDFEEQISKKNYYHIFIEAATQTTSITCNIPVYSDV